jgi:hypothetical protein
MKLSDEQLKQIFDSHNMWLAGNGGTRANLSGADLSGANLSGANLSYANLSKANLSGVNLSYAHLSGANLSEADLSGAYLSEADLSAANLSKANLSKVNLSGANLSKANLNDADLSRANLSGADLSGANLSKATLSYAILSYADLSCTQLDAFQIVPEEGCFTAFKKLKDGIAKLYVPASAKRVGGLVGRKCRVSKVKVVSITDFTGKQLKSSMDRYNGKTLYHVGSWVKPDKFDDDIRVECTNGIHIFLTRKEAEDYIY